MILRIVPLFLLASSASLVNGRERYSGGSLTAMDLPFDKALLETLTGPVAPDLTTLLDPVLVPTKDITFHLFTRENPEEVYLLKVGDTENLNASTFSALRPTKIVIHGWTDGIGSYWFTNFRRNYLSVGDYNVIGLDWSPGSAREYFTAARLTRQVGEYLAALLDFLGCEANLSLAGVHVLGHSLGAHVAGFAGAAVSGRIGRITGMDPARPAFEAPYSRKPEDRLDQSDARFVDVIHTCAGSAGFAGPVGHADFYPNGGGCRQPGCSILVTIYCSHDRAHDLMAESIVNREGFAASECDSWWLFKAGSCGPDPRMTLMGEGVDLDARGIFYLETNAESRLSLGASRKRSLPAFLLPDVGQGFAAKSSDER